MLCCAVLCCAVLCCAVLTSTVSHFCRVALDLRPKLKVSSPPSNTRLKWSHTCWTISCVMNAMALGVLESLRLSSVPTWHVCSITVNSAGPSFIHVLDENSTNLLSRRVLTGQGQFHSGGKWQSEAVLLCVKWFQSHQDLIIWWNCGYPD